MPLRVRRIYAFGPSGGRIAARKYQTKTVELQQRLTLIKRLQHLFTRGDDGRRAINDGNDMLDHDPHWREYISFYEFFDADTGRGLGASHQCGWTGLIAKIIHDTGYVMFSIISTFTRSDYAGMRFIIISIACY